jgi:hypothetical protein
VGRNKKVMTTRLLTAPVLMPGVPDCDIQNGETPLTTEQVTHLMNTYKQYQVIDYEHEYMFDGKWFLRNLGKPERIWQSKNETTYTDRFGIERTAPRGTWWQTTRVTDPEAIKLIDDEKLNAYSLTTVNKQFLDKFLQQTSSQVNTKTNTELEDLLKEYGLSTKHRTPIAKIKDPVGFTVSLVGMPCVGGAVFARSCLEQSGPEISKKSGDEKMADNKETSTTGMSIEDIKSLFSFFSSIKSEEKPEPEEEPKTEPEEKVEEEYVTRDELKEALDENNEKIIKEISDLIDEKLPKDEDEDKEEAPKEDEETGAKEEGEDKISTKSTEPTTVPQSQQLDDPDTQEEQISYKKGTPEYQILNSLGRDALGNSKIRL